MPPSFHKARSGKVTPFESGGLTGFNLRQFRSLSLAPVRAVGSRSMQTEPPLIRSRSCSLSPFESRLTDPGAPLRVPVLEDVLVVLLIALWFH